MRCACGFEGVEVWFLRLDGGRGFSPSCRYCQQGWKSPCPPPAPARKPMFYPYTPMGAARAASRAGVERAVFIERVAEGRKYCFDCETWKRRGDFALDRTSVDGRSRACKKCRRDYMRAWRAVTGA